MSDTPRRESRQLANPRRACPRGPALSGATTTGASQDLEAAVDLLAAVTEGIRPWGDIYFPKEGYDDTSASERAKLDAKMVLERNYAQVFEVPTSPLEALIASPAAGGRTRERQSGWQASLSGSSGSLIS
jgi:hypothetical protein